MSLKEFSWEDFLKLKSSNEPLHKMSVVTGSMVPLIPVGATIVVDKTAEYHVNDIIVYWHSNKLIVHILWNINKSIKRNNQEILVTRSLNAISLDATISHEQVLGKVINYKLSLMNLFSLYILKKFKRY